MHNTFFFQNKSPKKIICASPTSLLRFLWMATFSLQRLCCCDSWRSLDEFVNTAHTRRACAARRHGDPDLPLHARGGGDKGLAGRTRVYKHGDVGQGRFHHHLKNIQKLSLVRIRKKPWWIVLQFSSRLFYLIVNMLILHLKFTWVEHQIDNK